MGCVRLRGLVLAPGWFPELFILSKTRTMNFRVDFAQQVLIAGFPHLAFGMLLQNRKREQHCGNHSNYTASNFIPCSVIIGTGAGWTPEKINLIRKYS